MTTNTVRISIDIKKQDHKRLKILADLHGMTIKEFVLNSLDPVLQPQKKHNQETLKAMEMLALEKL